MKVLIEMLKDAERQPLRVAVDVDQTLALVHPLMLDNFNSARGTNYTIEDHRDWDFKSIESDYEEMMPFYADVWKKQHTRIPFLGDVKQITEMTRHYNVEILTTRSPTAEGVTGGTVDAMNDWLRIHQLSHIPVVICDPKQNKARAFDYHVYVDDSPRLAVTIEEMEGKFMLLVDRNYNKEIRDSPKIVRVADVKEAATLLIKIARKQHRKLRA